MSSLKQKTISGLSWSFVDTFARYGLTFFISIILARFLTPSDFGLVGMTAIFFAISRTFIDNGYRLALIREQKREKIYPERMMPDFELITFKAVQNVTVEKSEFND